MFEQPRSEDSTEAAGAPDVLFDGDDAMFKALAQGVSTYAEYGSGASTRWVAAHTDAQIVSVESDREWAESVQDAIGDRGTVSHVRMGPVGKWGRPKTYAKRGRFATYQEWPWRDGAKPELVLVDGRFRVACFLASLLEARPGTPIIFDDYGPRPHYRVVEEFVEVAERCGRQAMFRTPDLSRKERKQVQRVRQAFRLVMD